MVVRFGLSSVVERRLWEQDQRASRAEWIRRHTFFDAAWYLTFHADVSHAGLDPWNHYVRHGIREGRSPGAYFDVAAYVRAYPDVARSGADPVMHFILSGAQEGRRFFVHSGGAGAESRLEPARLPEREDVYRLSRVLDAWTGSRATAFEAVLARCARRPLISVLMPVFMPDLAHLHAAVASVRAQVYTNWQLCIADDATGSAALTAWLDSVCAIDPRIVVTTRAARGHISAATNSAAEQATGEFLLLLDQDDLLAPDALARCAMEIDAQPDVDFLYSDSDKIDDAGRHYAPHYKPGFSPELLLAYMCAGQVLCIRSSLWRQLDGLREGFEGSQDHDLALRATELARRVVHIPQVLYHWRSVAGSTARDGGAKPYGFAAGLRAVEEALKRRGSGGRAVRPNWAVANDNAVFELVFGDEGPSVAIIIPTRNRLRLIRDCISSLEQTSYRNFRVLIVDNGSDDPATTDWLDGIGASAPHRVSVVRAPDAPGGSFNFSRLVNAGVDAVDTDFVVLLNNDTRVIAPAWLSVLVGYGQLPGVGAVGGLLLYPDGTVQHAGVYHSGRPPHHVGHLHRGGEAGKHDLMFARNVSAVTAACMLVRRSTYLAMGGFDEERFGVAYNDVDFSYRLRAAGQRIVFAPGAVLYHEEGATRGSLDDPMELRHLIDRHGHVQETYINPNMVVDDHPTPQPRRYAAKTGHPLRLLASTHNLNREGAPKALLETCRWMAREDRATVTLVSPRDGPLGDAFRAAGVTVEIESHPLTDTPTAAEYEERVTMRGRMIRDRGFDMVLANTILDFHVIDAAHEARLPSVWTIHENEGWKSHLGRLPAAVGRRARACFGHPWRVVFVSEASRGVYGGLDFHNNAMVIPGGIPPDWAHEVNDAARAATRRRIGAEAGDMVVLSVGTLCARKRQVDLVTAFARLTAAGARAQLVLVGATDGAYVSHLGCAVDALPAAARARLHIIPETDMIQPFYAAADVFVLCSAQESYPHVILEAMASGLPILTTAVGGIAEQVRPGVNATCHAAGDVDALTAALLNLSDDPAARARQGAASRELHGTLNSSEDFSRALWQVVCEGVGSAVPPSRLACM